MKKERALFVGFVTVFFIICYLFMGQHYDPLARYIYVDDENREQILDAVSKSDIQLLIDYDIRPEEFLPFVEVDGYDILNAKAYYVVYQAKEVSKEEVVASVNTILQHMSVETLSLYLEDYSLAEIVDWVTYKDSYNEESIFIYRPTSYDTFLDERYTVGRYVPKDLEDVVAMRSLISNGTMQLSKETNDALGKMCSLLEDEFHETCGGLIATQGYMSYEEQLKKYDEYLLKYGPNDVNKYFLYPGHNEWQLGNTVGVIVKEDIAFKMSAQYQWLMKHASEYGFVFRTPNSNVLRYVGKDLAKYLVDNQLSLEEARVDK